MGSSGDGEFDDWSQRVLAGELRPDLGQEAFGRWGAWARLLHESSGPVSAEVADVPATSRTPHGVTVDCFDDHWWSTCAQHGIGLDPSVDGDRAVWRCHPGDHVLAAIGELGDSGRPR